MQSQEKIVREEQHILDDLIREMDAILLRINKRLTNDELQIKKAKEKCLPDTYGALVTAQNDKNSAKKLAQINRQSRNELYEDRIVVKAEDGSMEEIKIGLHSYISRDKVLIMSWQMPLCQRFILDNSATEYDGVVVGKHGGKYHTHYTLQMKRKVDLHFDKVEKAEHLYPLTHEEAEKIIADEFLQELLSRRSEQEFRNIVFSIQKQQGEIIQTPFKQDLIVQGCAGSGKSMIMLHRLPIILINNPNGLDRNNLYIITPSIAYIQMANNMRIDLEIEDLNMGTLEQYYNHVLLKYGISSDVYGQMRDFQRLPENLEKYIYSEQCILDIQNELEKLISNGKMEYQLGQEMFNLKTRKIASTFANDKIVSEILATQDILTENDKILKKHHDKIKSAYEAIDEFSRVLSLRKISVTRSIAKKISEEQDLISEKRKELEKLGNKEDHEIAYGNRENVIHVAEKNIEDLREVQMIVDLDNDYFTQLKKYSESIQELLSLWKEFDKLRENMDIATIYICIAQKRTIIEQFRELCAEIIEFGDPYYDYAERIMDRMNQTESMVNALELYNENFLDYDFLCRVKLTNKYYVDLKSNAVNQIYAKIMEKLGVLPDEKGKRYALNCSPYLYLQIVYLYQGMPNGVKESLITIDEAQNVMPVELKLIKAVNNNKVILNLFGDVKQHISSSKGIDNWGEIKDVASFKVFNMQENYRNARQITEYCNKRFSLKMRAINTDGAGVHLIQSQDEFALQLRKVFIRPQNPGLSCIIVRNREEAKTIVAMASSFNNRIFNMIEHPQELKTNKWNLMTVEQAKGLEFETVFAITGRMEQNEKYITYTRALDELFVYDIELAYIKQKDDVDKEIARPKVQETAKNARKKREKKSTTSTVIESGVSDFFKEAGLEIIDLRKSTGFLWVIGEKEELKNVVDQAIKKFNITGMYGSGKASGYRPGWYTKTKK